MPLHVIAWSGAKTDSTANEAAPVVADESITPSATGNRYLVDYNATIVAAIARNDTIARARFNIPSYRDVGMPEVYPLDAQAEPAADYDVCVWGPNGPKLRANEGIGADSSNGASTVDNVTIVAFLMTQMDPVPAGRRFTVRGTATQTLVANAWTTAAITLDQDLPAGRYGVIGIACVCNDGHAARLVFPSNPKFRPGCGVGETIAINDPRQTFRAGQFGLLGQFTDRAPPQLQILGGTAGAETPAVYLDLVEMGNALSV